MSVHKPTAADFVPGVQVDSVDAICPYCGHRYQVESEDYDEFDRDEACEGCGKTYTICQSFEVSTHTRPKEVKP